MNRGGRRRRKRDNRRDRLPRAARLICLAAFFSRQPLGEYAGGQTGDKRADQLDDGIAVDYEDIQVSSSNVLPMYFPAAWPFF
jgi:hypothetical protein